MGPRAAYASTPGTGYAIGVVFCMDIELLKNCYEDVFVDVHASRRRGVRYEWTRVRSHKRFGIDVDLPDQRLVSHQLRVGCLVNV